MMSARVVVIGVGNPLLGDEGLGIAAVERLGGDRACDVELVDGGTASLDALLDAKEAQRVIVVDAIDGGREPGTLLRLDGRELVGLAGTPELSLHQVGLKENVCLAQLSGFDVDRLVVVGMQPAGIEPCMHLSPAVEKGMGALLSEIRQEIRRVGHDTHKQEAD